LNKGFDFLSEDFSEENFTEMPWLEDTSIDYDEYLTVVAKRKIMNIHTNGMIMKLKKMQRRMLIFLIYRS